MFAGINIIIKKRKRQKPTEATNYNGKKSDCVTAEASEGAATPANGRRHPPRRRPSDLCPQRQLTPATPPSPQNREEPNKQAGEKTQAQEAL